ncbi:MAG: PP2C family protein-serine/threonine phosphatase [Bacteroidales bacterium]
MFIFLIDGFLWLIKAFNGTTIINLVFYAVIIVSLVWLIARLYSGALFKIIKLLRERESELSEIRLRLSELEYKTKNMTDSLIYAQRIQEALLPPESFLAENFKEYFIFYKPRDIVSGDFYWFGSEGGKHFIVVADCTGHGVPGALLSMIGHNLLSQIIKDRHIDIPGEVLNNLNNSVKTIFTREKKNSELLKDGMDIGICAIDTGKKIMEFSGAFASLYIAGNGKLLEIIGDKYVMGMKPEHCSYTSHVVNFETGNVIYMFSDGYADQFGGEENKKFMYRRFRYLLTTIHMLPMNEQKIILVDTINAWKGDNVQVDDILVIGVRF